MLYLEPNQNLKKDAQYYCLKNILGYEKIAIEYCKNFIKMKKRKLTIEYIQKYIYFNYMLIGRS